MGDRIGDGILNRPVKGSAGGEERKANLFSRLVSSMIDGNIAVEHPVLHARPRCSGGMSLPAATVIRRTIHSENELEEDPSMCADSVRRAAMHQCIV